MNQKSNAAKAQTPKPPTVAARPVVDQAPESERHPKGAEPTIDYSKYSDDELDVAWDIINAEYTKRAEAKRASAPKAGARVVITGGSKKLVGKQGLVKDPRQTKAFVEIEGRFEYISFQHLKVVDG